MSADVCRPILSPRMKGNAMKFREKYQEVKAIPKQINLAVVVSVIAILIGVAAIVVSLDTRGKANAN